MVLEFHELEYYKKIFEKFEVYFFKEQIGRASCRERV